LTHPAVTEAVCFGIADRVYGEASLPAYQRLLGIELTLTGQFRLLANQQS